MNGRLSWALVWAFAGSRHLSVFVLVMGATYALILAVFGVLVETRWLHIIAGLYPFRLLYALFFLNLALCGFAWVPTVLLRCATADPPGLDGPTRRLEHAVEVPAAGTRVDDLSRRLRRLGYTVSTKPDQFKAGNAARLRLHASRGRYSLMGNLLFHAGFLLLLAGAATNALYRFEGVAIIAEGGAFGGAVKDYRTIVDDPAKTLPTVDFDVEKISAEFWEGKVFFTALEARLVHRGGRAVAALSSAARVGDADITVTGFGYAPFAVLKDASGQVLRQAQVKLNVFPPGSEDYFLVPGYPHRVFVSFFPDHAVVNGRHVSKSMDPVNPAYFLRVLRGRVPVFTGLVRPGESASFDGLSLSLPSFARFGDFRIVRNPGHPVIWAAFLVMTAGLAWRLLWYRKTVALWQDEGGRAWLAGRFDYFPKLNAGWLEDLAVELRSAPA